MREMNERDNTRHAKGLIMEQVLLKNKDEEKWKLISQYRMEKEPLRSNSQKILVGSWFTNAVNLLKKGATGEELQKVVEFIVLAMAAGYYGIDIGKAYQDRGLFDLMRKYFPKYGLVVTKIPEGDEVLFTKDTVEIRKMRNEEIMRKRKNFYERVKLLKDHGLTTEEIAKVLGLPESAILNVQKQ